MNNLSRKKLAHHFNLLTFSCLIILSQASTALQHTIKYAKNKNVCTLHKSHTQHDINNTLLRLYVGFLTNLIQLLRGGWRRGWGEIKVFNPENTRWSYTGNQFVRQTIQMRGRQKSSHISTEIINNLTGGKQTARGLYTPRKLMTNWKQVLQTKHRSH